MADGRIPVPDLIEPIIAYRTWQLSVDGRLMSPFRPNWYWTDGINVALCLRTQPRTQEDTKSLEYGPPLPSPHPETPAVIPNATCQCGLYAYCDFHAIMRQSQTPPTHTLVYGQVSLWGRVQAHIDGYRAQYAQIRAIALSDALSLYGGRKDLQENIQKAAEHYQVPVLKMEELYIPANHTL